MTTRVLLAFSLIALLAPPAAGQAPSLIGTWRVTDERVKNGPREVIIREDSSASWGEEHARWRLADKGKRIMIALGGMWEIYDLKISRNKLTLSGPELGDPVTLTKVGPPTPRPTGVPIPPDPDQVPPGA